MLFASSPEHDLYSGIAIAAGALCGMAAFSAVPLVGLFVLFAAIRKCSRRNRTMAPALVWLNVVPLFNVVWSFVTVVHVHWSLGNEYRARGRQDGANVWSLWTGLSACALLWLWMSCGPLTWFGGVEVPPAVGMALGWGWFACACGYLALVLSLSGKLPAYREPSRRARADDE
jgi:hypothetical protein